jgi:ABC-2 type transport system ATP-binding protein
VRPVTWQGRVITALALGLMLVALLVVRRPWGAPGAVVVAALYLVVGYATGGATRASREPSAPDESSAPPVTATATSAPAPVAPATFARVARETASRAGDLAGRESAIEVAGLTKRFGERDAFRDVSFRVAAGEVFGFLGPNGAGKTTMVRTLSTLVAPTSGSATVAGLALGEGHGEAIRQQIAVMTESPGLYGRLSVRENLEFFAGLYRLSDARGRIERALEAVNLAGRANDPCASLSKGLRQRVGLARVLLNDPAIIFLDEPTSGLDPVATREVLDLIGALRQRGVTIFLTTHRLEEAERLCDRVAILNTTLRIVGDTEELRRTLFARSLEVATAAPLADPAAIFAAIPGVASWRGDGDGRYVLDTPEPRDAAPYVARALVAAGADVESIGESHHSLEDVYLQLIDEDAAVSA